MNNNDKTRVVMVVEDFPLPYAGVNGGIQGVSLYLSQALAEMPEVDLQVIVPLASPGAGGLKQVYGLQVHFLEQKKRARLIYAANTGAAQELIKELSPHIVHFQGLSTWANRCPLPNIATIHGIAERDMLYKGAFIPSRIKFLIIWLIEARARRRVRNLIAINPYVRKFLGSSRNQRVWDIPNPVSKDFFTARYQPEVGRIFSASNMLPLKNTHTLIKAFAQIAADDPRLELRLAGSDQESIYGRQCRSLVNILGLNERVKFLGLLTLKGVREELSKASCFALCSFQENAPLSISEAMAVGVPVVASRVGGIPWMIADGVTGVLVDPMNVADIAVGLNRVLYMEDRTRMEMAVKGTARALFEPAEVARKTLDAYKYIIESQKG